MITYKASYHWIILKLYLTAIHYKHINIKSRIVKKVYTLIIGTMLLLESISSQNKMCLTYTKCHYKLRQKDIIEKIVAISSIYASQQGTLTLPDTWFRPPFWDLLMLQLLRPNSSNLPCLYSTFHLEYPLVLSRFCFAKEDIYYQNVR